MNGDGLRTKLLEIEDRYNAELEQADEAWFWKWQPLTFAVLAIAGLALTQSWGEFGILAIGLAATLATGRAILIGSNLLLRRFRSLRWLR